MTSNRLAHVYRSKEWKELREVRIAMANGRCEWREQNITGWERCPVMDKNYGGTESLTVDHTELRANPMDIRFTKAYCRRHHGVKDGGKRLR
jgi:hypothetical protein